ncbi:MAG TPA: hypothetical protein VFI23_11990 [Rhizomicrobium sp.]|nr:hypothetical protein [Rhizomicrobium sp.]
MPFCLLRAKGRFLHKPNRLGTGIRETFSRSVFDLRPECPLWVKSGHSLSGHSMSALRQQRPFTRPRSCLQFTALLQNGLDLGPIKTIVAGWQSRFGACVSRQHRNEIGELIPDALGEVVMAANTKIEVTFAALFAMAAAALSPALAQTTCLDVRQIRDTKVSDVSTIYFQMKDRKVYRNTLPSPCNQLKFSAFGWHARGGKVCAKQAIRLDKGGVCMLGDFALVSEPKKGG